MSGEPLSPEDFDAMYRADPDPWAFATSEYEQGKYRETVAAAVQDREGAMPRAIELGAAAGVLSAMLAPHCGHLVTLECAPTAVALARERLAGADGGDRCEPLVGVVPEDLPEDRFDLVVASEVLYYLPEDRFRAAVHRTAALLAPGARLVAVHWTGSAPRHVRSGDDVHDALRAHPGLRPVRAERAEGYVLDVLEPA